MTKEERLNKYISVSSERRLDNMRAFCYEQGIKSYAQFLEYCKDNNPDWFKTAINRGGRSAMMSYFSKRS